MQTHSSPLIRNLVTLGPAGYVRGGGTLGALICIPFGIGIALIPWPPVRWAIVVLGTIIGTHWIVRYLGPDTDRDPSEVIIDEFYGCLIALQAAPLDWRWFLAAFALFRLFDIAKPWPVSWADKKVHGGLGVMLDDVLAGLMAAGVLIGARFTPWF